MEDINTCKRCGAPIHADAKYCKECEIEMEIKQREMEIEM